MLRDTANKVLFDNCTIAFDGTAQINPALAEQYGVDMAEVDAQFGTKDGVDENYQHTVFKADDSNCIVKLIHNSDSGSGTESSGEAPVVTIANSEMAGDILNTAAMTGDDYTATSGPAGVGVRTPRSLVVELSAADVTGAISLGQDEWEVTYFASGANMYQPIGYAKATELGMFCEEGYGLSLSLKDGSVWTVNRDSYLTALVIDDTSAIQGADGAAVSMTVDGEAVEIVPGEYTGAIIIDVE